MMVEVRVPSDKATNPFLIKTIRFLYASHLNSFAESQQHVVEQQHTDAFCVSGAFGKAFSCGLSTTTKQGTFWFRRLLAQRLY